MILLLNASTLPFALLSEESSSTHLTAKYPLRTADYTDWAIKDWRNSPSVSLFLVGPEPAGERLVINMLHHNLDGDIVYLLGRMYLY